MHHPVYANAKMNLLGMIVHWMGMQCFHTNLMLKTLPHLNFVWYVVPIMPWTCASNILPLPIDVCTISATSKILNHVRHCAGLKLIQRWDQIVNSCPALLRQIELSIKLNPILNPIKKWTGILKKNQKTLLSCCMTPSLQQRMAPLLNWLDFCPSKQQRPSFKKCNNNIKNIKNIKKEKKKKRMRKVPLCRDKKKL